MFCGGCFRDNALVTELRRQGHETLMVPLYLPLTLDEADQTQGTPIFFSGINVYLEQKSPLYRSAPAWLKNVFSSHSLLKFAGRFAGKTRASDVGEIALSMLRGEEGQQAKELDDLISWLKTTSPRPDIICLSNALLTGLAKRLKSELNVPVACVLQGEDTFLDGLPSEYRESAWNTLRSRVSDIDLFIPPSDYFAQLMTSRLGLNPQKVKVIHNGINLDGYQQSNPPSIPVLGYFARMCPDKGLGLAVETYLRYRKANPDSKLQFHIGGGCGPGDMAFVQSIKKTLKVSGFENDVKFFPNVTRAEKLEFFKGLTVFSTPALYGEAFGLYLLEAMASGVPVVQPRHAAFPEIVAATGGGLIAEANPNDLAEKIAQLVNNPPLARELGIKGRTSVLERFSISALAKNTISAYTEVINGF